MAYVYRHVRLDKNEPFYIGVGTDKNYKRAHEKCPSRRNEIWLRIVSKTKFTVDILFDNISDEEAKQKEIEFVKLYGRKDIKTGTLANRTAGGDGVIERVFSPEYRKKLSDASKRRIVTEEQKDYLRKLRIGVPLTIDARLKISAANKGRPKTAHDRLIGSVVKRGDKNPMYGNRRENCPAYKGKVQIYKNNILVATVEGIKEAADFIGCPEKTRISAVITGRRKSTYGYTFKRVEV